MLMNLCSNYNKTSCVIRLTISKLIITWNHIKVYPLAVYAFNHTLCTKNSVILYEALEYLLDSCTFKLVRSLLTPACKYIVSMVVVMIMVMASTGAILAMLMMMFMVVVIMVMVIMVVVVMFVMIMVMVVMLMMVMVVMLVVMLVVMASTCTVLVMLMMVMVVMLVIMMVMVVMMMSMLFLIMCMSRLSKHLNLKVVLSLYNIKNLSS